MAVTIARLVEYVTGRLRQARCRYWLSCYAFAIAGGLRCQEILARSHVVMSRLRPHHAGNAFCSGIGDAFSYHGRH